MITPGINENIQFLDPTINEKGTLEINLKQVTGDGDKSYDEGMKGFMDSFSSSDDDTSGDDLNQVKILIFGVDVLDVNKNPKEASDISKELSAVRDPLNHILSAYLSKDRIKWNPFLGTGMDNPAINDAQRKQLIQKQEVVDTIYRNIVSNFMQMWSTIPNKTELFRVLLLRRSKEKHFPTFRRKFLSSNPFIESMKIPLENSGLSFTPWELSRNLDDPTPSPQSDGRDEEESKDSTSLSQLIGSASIGNASPAAAATLQQTGNNYTVQPNQYAQPQQTTQPQPNAVPNQNPVPANGTLHNVNQVMQGTEGTAVPNRPEPNPVSDLNSLLGHLPNQ